MREVDALVVGAGPAGATVALNLAPFCRRLLVDRRASPGPRIGESLVPAARRLLADMGLLEAFLAEGHAPHHGNRAWWNGDVAQETDFLRDLDGPGWHLDRPASRPFSAVAPGVGAPSSPPRPGSSSWRRVTPGRRGAPDWSTNTAPRT